MTNDEIDRLAQLAADRFTARHTDRPAQRSTIRSGMTTTLATVLYEELGGPARDALDPETKIRLRATAERLANEKADLFRAILRGEA